MFVWIYVWYLYIILLYTNSHEHKLTTLLPFNIFKFYVLYVDTFYVYNITIYLWLYMHIWWWSTTTKTCSVQYNKLIDLLTYLFKSLIIYNRINVLHDSIKVSIFFVCHVHWYLYDLKLWTGGKKLMFLTLWTWVWWISKFVIFLTVQWYDLFHKAEANEIDFLSEE
jgi:hypothetical protein